MKRTTIVDEFVEYVPSVLSEGALYVSITYGNAVHKCACGCGNKVATPITPADWKLIYDGDAVSLTPSIGNRGFPCRSHFWIRSNQIRWSSAWTDEQIAAGRARDDHDRTQHFARRANQADDDAKMTLGNLPKTWRRRFRWPRRTRRQ